MITPAQGSRIPPSRRYYADPYFPNLIRNIQIECAFLGLFTALFISVVMATIVEFLERERGIAAKKALDVAIPDAYLFLGFFVMFGYNDVIAASRFYGAYDGFFIIIG